MCDNKVFHCGRARQEELDEIDQCKLCKIMPELEKTCYATKYCHRQMKMEIEGTEGRHDRETQAEADSTAGASDIL